MAGDAGSVSESSNCVRTLVKPALHVGEQIGGRSGCRATAGRAGIAGGGTTTGGGDGCDSVAQPLASIKSASSIGAGEVELSLGIVGRLLCGCGSALFFGAGGFGGQAASFGNSGLNLRGFTDEFGVVALFCAEACGLDAERDPQRKGGGHGDSGGCDGERERDHFSVTGLVVMARMTEITTVTMRPPSA